jgi:dihydrolipoamide dehydrogenase
MSGTERSKGAEVRGDGETRTVDVAVIGAGTAGLAAYRAAKKLGKEAVLIESGAYGTTCARVGCMPSKLLIAAAEAAHHARHAGPFGVNTTVKVDGRAVMERVRRERDRFVGFVLESVDNIPADHRLTGHARFVGPNDLDVAGKHVRARTTVIATGSAPVIPAMFDGIRDRLVINDDVFAWDDLPKSIVVFGAGVIGLEIGQALHRLGVHVRIFGRSGTVGPLTDPVVKAAAAAVLRSELLVDFDAQVRAVERDGKGVSVRWLDTEGNERLEHFDTALVAAGRRPNITGLGLENTGIGPEATVNRTTLQWGDTNIFIAGDANEDIPLLHEAADEGAIAGANAARYPDVRPGKRRTPLAIAFTEPALAVVAGGFPAASAHGLFVVGEVDFGDQGRSRIMLQNKGAARLYADPSTRRFLGAEIAGPRAEHLAHLLAWAHQSELTIDQMLAMPFYHPVVEEGLRTALRDVAAKLDSAAASSAKKVTAESRSAQPTSEPASE